MPKREKLADFAEWCGKHITGVEKGQAQIFLDRLFQAFGQPGSLDVGGHPEFRVRKPDEDGGGTAFADLIWNPVVFVEIKKRGRICRRTTTHVTSCAATSRTLDLRFRFRSRFANGHARACPTPGTLEAARLSRSGFARRLQRVRAQPVNCPDQAAMVAAWRVTAGKRGTRIPFAV